MQTAIKEAIILPPRPIAMPAMLLILIAQPIQSTRHLDFLLPALSAIQRIPTGNLHLTLSMIQNHSLYIQENTEESGIHVRIVMPMHLIMRNLHALAVMSITRQIWIENTGVREVIHTTVLPVSSVIQKEMQTNLL